MTLVDFPKPNGRTLQEKYEYAKFLMLCKAPTLELIKFFEREQENFTFELGSRLYTNTYELIWSKGDLFQKIILSKTDLSLMRLTSGGDFEITCTGFDWATSYEKQFLYAAVDKLVTRSKDRSRLLAEAREREKNEVERNSIKFWLEDHEES